MPAAGRMHASVPFRPTCHDFLAKLTDCCFALTVRAVRSKSGDDWRTTGAVSAASAKLAAAAQAAGGSSGTAFGACRACCR